MGSKQNPGSFDCYEKALPDEPMFVLLARDPHAPRLIEAWAIQRRQDIDTGERPKTDQAVVDEAVTCAESMRAWRHRNLSKWRQEGK